MPELITRDGGQMSSTNFMRLFKCVIPDGVIDGCSINKSGSVIHIGSGHIIACGALIEVEDISVTVSSSGELVMRIDTAAENQAQIIARKSAPLTQKDLTNGGSVYELRLASYTYSSGSITSLSVTAGSSSSNGSTPPSGSTTNSGGTTQTSGEKTYSGILVDKVSATVSSPTVHYSAKYKATRSNSSLSVNLTFAAWLNSSSSKLGTGAKLTIYARINGGSWQSAVIKKTADSWSGTSQHTVSLTLSANTTSGTDTIDFYVTRNGSTFAGTAGNLGSASNPKNYTVKLI